jgi:biofilm PGA synthesis N-glycosyltransferase PgaC
LVMIGVLFDSTMSNTARYVLMTAAKDEARFVGLMIESVAKQSIRPLRHIVVDDGSKDETEQIVRSYENTESFVHLRARPRNEQRNYSSKVAALQAAYDDLKTMDFDYIGCLDADITLPVDYYEGIISRMRSNPKLGVASGRCLQKSGADWIKIMSNSRHVPGAMQFFTRECYQAIGGYQKVTVAGVDSLAEIKARMLGWETRSFDDIFGYHHKPIGSATGGKVKTSYRRGMTDYLLGKHPLFVLLKSVRRLAIPPYGLDAAAHLAGYFGLFFRGKPRDVSEEVRKYVRAEEMQVLRDALLRGRRPY